MQIGLPRPGAAPARATRPRRSERYPSRCEPGRSRHRPRYSPSSRSTTGCASMSGASPDRAFSQFFVEGGVAIRVASTTVPSRSISPRCCRCALIRSKITWVRSFCSSSQRNCSRVAATGPSPRLRSIDNAPDHITVIDRVLNTLFRQVEELMRQIHPQPPFQTPRWTAPLSLRYLSR